LAEQNIESIAEPSVQAVQAEIGKHFIFKAIVEVRPEVTLGEYKGLSVVVAPKEEISDAKMDEQLDMLRRQHAVMVPVEDRGAELGDVVTLRIEGTIEGEPIDLGESQEMNIELKEDSFVRGFSDQILGLKAGDEKNFDLTFPADYHIEDLRDKPISFEVKVHDVKAVELPAIDDEFAKSVGDFENLDALKERITSDLDELLEDQFEIRRQQKVLDAVVANAEVEVPESMLSRELFAMWQMGEGAQLQNAKVSEPTLRASLMNWMQRDDMKDTARQRIKTTLVLGAIARAEGITIAQDEVDNEIQEMADSYQIPVAQVKQQLEQEGRTVALMDELLSYKIIDWVLENNEVQIGEEAAAESEAELAEQTA
jgi:trigger factor